MTRQPTFLESISTIIVMIIIVITGFVVFEIPIQALLILASAYAAFIARRVGLKWQDLEEGITHRLATAMPAIFIILAVGIIVGTWMYSGTVPALIYYGLEFLDPNLFLVSAFIICAITSVATGTAWGSASTAGIALMAIATQLHITPGMAAGAIIAGAVFGDKMSPLSDTTNLAALVTKVNIFAHIRAMIWTTVPASIIGLIVWYFAGMQFGGNTNTSQVNQMLSELSKIYNINIFVWIPLLIIITCLLLKISTVPAMLISSLSAIIVTIFCGYAFAGIVEKAGCLDVILKTISKNINSVGQLILATVIGSLIMVLAAGVASVVIIMVGVLMMEMYNDMNLDRSNLSRTLEDSGTMIIPLIPWGTSGIYYTQQLGVSVDQFFIWAVPCYLCIIFAIFYGFSGIGIKKAKSQ
ncbi:Na+/H+ antiporter NhaC family protein [Staphylococcus equorum]|uniref:Na+/H+ antiporter NhaC family protein n=1 Tax=Staphylococcus equorum TaxID=246432 RepID=UPI002557304F|nr:Na+/H+ antiporter NhaC family protein [Staphylococcus equorum]MDK9868385.1 Na+/H+ antiporter NhaC family protein [Staphylococcus equorum]